jgi:hypothetical protein
LLLTLLAGQHESAMISLDRVWQPVCARFGAGQCVHSARGESAHDPVRTFNDGGVEPVVAD